jgi:hypothetical protein
MIRRFCLNLKPTQLANASQIRFNRTAVMTQPDLKSNIAKINSLSLKIRTDYLTPEVINRLAACPTEFVVDLITNLTDYGFLNRELATVLRTYDDWSVLTRKQLANSNETFRGLSLNTELFRSVFAGNPNILNADLKFLSWRLHDLKYYLTNRHLELVLPKSPHILTDNFNNFRYKFVYLYILMGVRQKEMCASYVFNHNIKHIRERHLFLTRALFYDTPTKKGATRVENPKLSAIMDTPVSEFLKRCTQGMFDEQDYQVFCDYLSEEFFENELLGNKIDKTLRNQILEAIKEERHLNFLKESEKEDD